MNRSYASFGLESQQTKWRPDPPQCLNETRKIPPGLWRAGIFPQQANRAPKQDAWLNLTTIFAYMCLEGIWIYLGWKCIDYMLTPCLGLQIPLTCRTSVLRLNKSIRIIFKKNKPKRWLFKNVQVIRIKERRLSQWKSFRKPGN